MNAWWACLPARTAALHALPAPFPPGSMKQRPDDDGERMAQARAGSGTRAMALIYLSADIQMLT